MVDVVRGDADPDVAGGAGFDVDTTGRLVRLRTLADTVGPGMRVLACGLNPSLVAADAGVAFVGATNRFWPAAIGAGLASVPRDPLHALEHHGLGLTDIVKRATARSHHLDRAEYAAGVGRVDRLVRWLQPGVVVFVGLEGYRAAVDRRAVAGPVAGGFGGRRAWLLPSTSGANAHVGLADLVAQLRAAVAHAGEVTS